jgi:hypothetical protein
MRLVALRPLFALTLLAPLAATVACSTAEPEKPVAAAPPPESPPPPAGAYEIQSINYDDANGSYGVFLLSPPEGQKPLWQSTNLRMARLTDEEIAAGMKASLVSDGPGGEAPVAKLPPDFNINYTHNVVEERGGQPVVVRQESTMWSPFSGMMMGMMLGSMMTPSYMYPPPYAAGRPLSGVGASGATASAAQQAYAQKHGTAPQSSRLSKSGYSKMPSAGSVKASGSGAGSSRLKNSSGAPTKAPKRSFGGGFGGRRRR